MNTRRLFLATTTTIITMTGLLFGPGSPAVGKGKPDGDGGDAGITNPAYAYVEDDAIFLMTVDGAQKQKLTNPKARTRDSSPSWSPDLDPETPGYQGKVAYLNHYEPGFIFGDLFVMNPDGSGKQLVRRFSEFPIPWDAQQTSLAWSPNGKEIIFNSSGDRLHAVEVATGNVRVVMERIFENRQVSWPVVSPLGMLSFASDGDIYVVDYQLDENGLMQIDRTTATNITGNETDTNEDLPSWSPDGTRLAFRSRTSLPTGTVSELVVYDFLLDEFIVILEDAGHKYQSWSPDGSQIVVDLQVTTPNGKFTKDLFRITDWADPNERQVINVTRTNRTREDYPRWNPGWTEE